MDKKFFWAIVLFFGFISVSSLFHSGLPPSHDGEYHVIRFYEFNKVFGEGNLYPRWAPDLNFGFGVPLFNYNYPLPNFVANFLHFLGLSFIDGLKANMILASILGAIFFYLWARQFWGNLGGVISSVFYTFSPYHFLDIYIRGSVGEVWALALFPAFLWSITKYIKDNNNLHAPLSALFLALIIFSHNILSIMFFFFAISYIVLLILDSKRKKEILPVGLILLAGIGISAIFWLPAILERNFVVGLKINDYAPNFPQLYQLIFPSWGSGFSGGLISEQLSPQIGIANLFAVFFALIVILRKINKFVKHIVIFSIFWFILLFFLMLEVSLPIWKSVPFMDYFQFPWRFLSLEILVCSFLGGSVVYLLKPKLLAAIMISLTFLLGIDYAKPAYYHLRSDNYYVSRSNFIDRTNSIGNVFNTIWAKDINSRAPKLVLEKGKGRIEDEVIKSTRYVFRTKTTVSEGIIVNTAYFPGWTAYMDGKKVDLKIRQRGNFSIPAAAGNHEYVVAFEETPPRKLADVITVFSLLFVLLNLFKFVRIKK